MFPARDRTGADRALSEFKNAAATPIRLTLREAARLGEFDSTQNVATAVATVPPQRRAG